MNEAQFKAAILKNITTKDSAINICMGHFVEGLRLLETGGSTQECKASFRSLHEELEQMKLQAEKEELIVRAIEQDIKDYDQLYQEKEKEISEVKDEIESLKQQLTEEKKQKQNKGEYLALSKLINQHPKRSETTKAIEGIEKELEATKVQSRQITEDLNKRSQQFQLVLHALNILQVELGTDSLVGMSQANKRKRTETKTTTEVPAKKLRTVKG
eukprot:TRINITY_DN5022_c0_g1_i1.p1 TRINITY_DN5022_c0_g1~~TRINITY_DN5022_c0_g1_i1.p1  ORF type:complete len:215 (+),score=59.56 TRINITY_DN5022_c0_g1_i1:253-897(+)